MPRQTRTTGCRSPQTASEIVCPQCMRHSPAFDIVVHVAMIAPEPGTVTKNGFRQGNHRSARLLEMATNWGRAGYAVSTAEKDGSKIGIRPLPQWRSLHNGNSYPNCYRVDLVHAGGATL